MLIFIEGFYDHIYKSSERAHSSIQHRTHYIQYIVVKVKIGG